MLLGRFGGPDPIDIRAAGYVIFFALLAAGFGILSVSHYRRGRLGVLVPILGIAGGPLLLTLVLVTVPAFLVALDVMPSA